ncbi:acyltransferase family protein [Shimazuella sp. AN120528]|uniref:acyltransferase family protein n=1 Tax=Shimazuella soli TaxID=1892854 RepID=UPI001F0DBD47|nr:acyltransferase family protein [Shimazuella soli]MCH5583652.1 acyltransferase family protein [Shimazuella soli]
MKNRIYYLDHIRVFLTILVLFHHAALPYTPLEGVWYVSDMGHEQAISSYILTFFIAINQAFFMGFFFFLAGYFTPFSLDRKKPRLFIKDRLIRLGIPILVYLFILSPIVQFMASTEKLNFWTFYKAKILSLQSIETGPIWFVEVLLIFTLIYVFLRFIWIKHPSNEEQAFPSSKKLLFTAILLGIFTFTIRLVYPIGFWVWGIQIAYLPSYLLLFYIGIIAGRKNWLETIPKKTTKQWIWCFAIVAPLFPLSLLFFQGNTNGGFNLQAFSYAMWESLIAFGICLGLLALFRKYANETGALWSNLSRTAFTVYIIHPIILVGYALLLKSTSLQPLFKFFTVGFIGTVTCFLLASIIVKIPYVNKVI